MSQRHVAATNFFVCTGELCENLCHCNGILLQQHVVATRCQTCTHEALCHPNLLLQLVPAFNLG